MAIFPEADAETITNALETFVLVARLYRRIISIAQADWESMVGTLRLLSIDDSPSLLYISALCREHFADVP